MIVIKTTRYRMIQMYTSSHATCNVNPRFLRMILQYIYKDTLRYGA